MKKRSPLTEPLPLPGAYLRSQKDKIVDGKVMPFFAATIFLSISAMIDWYFYLINLPRSPWVITVMAIIAVVVCIIYFLKFKKQIANYNIGAEGEVVVGQLLEGLRTLGFVPIHDVPCENNGKRFNVDHVLIGPKGIFAVETKTWRKNKGLTESINYSNGKIFAGKSIRDAGAIKQARMNAEWMEKLLMNRTRERTPVRPLLLLPGWFIEKEATSAVEKEHGVLMLNPKALGSFFDKFPEVFNQEQTTRIVAVVSAYVHEEATRQAD